MQVQTFSVGVTKPTPSDRYAVLAGVDASATAINWNGQTNTTFQSGEWRLHVSTVAYVCAIAVPITYTYTPLF